LKMIFEKIFNGSDLFSLVKEGRHSVIADEYRALRMFFSTVPQKAFVHASFRVIQSSPKIAESNDLVNRINDYIDIPINQAITLLGPWVDTFNEAVMNDDTISDHYEQGLIGVVALYRHDVNRMREISLSILFSDDLHKRSLEFQEKFADLFLSRRLQDAFTAFEFKQTVGPELLKIWRRLADKYCQKVDTKNKLKRVKCLLKICYFDDSPVYSQYLADIWKEAASLWEASGKKKQAALYYFRLSEYESRKELLREATKHAHLAAGFFLDIKDYSSFVDVLVFGLYKDPNFLLKYLPVLYSN